jgi:hypothetical protein
VVAADVDEERSCWSDVDEEDDGPEAMVGVGIGAEELEVAVDPGGLGDVWVAVPEEEEEEEEEEACPVVDDEDDARVVDKDVAWAVKEVVVGLGLVVEDVVGAWVEEEVVVCAGGVAVQPARG